MAHRIEQLLAFVLDKKRALLRLQSNSFIILVQFLAQSITCVHPMPHESIRINEKI